LWFTPEKPLLAGTKRAFLIKTGRILTTQILITDRKDFEKFMLVNAMLDFDENRASSIINICF
jgi:4-amino-4-deoxychorismate lyase